MQVIDLHEKEMNKPKQFVNANLVISFMVTPKGDLWLKLIDCRQVQYFGDLDSLFREIH